MNGLHPIALHPCNRPLHECQHRHNQKQDDGRDHPAGSGVACPADHAAGGCKEEGHIADYHQPDLPKIDLEYCKGCGICAEECPVDAISMVDESTPIAEEK